MKDTSEANFGNEGSNSDGHEEEDAENHHQPGFRKGLMQLFWTCQGFQRDKQNLHGHGHGLGNGGSVSLDLLERCSMEPTEHIQTLSSSS